MKRRLLLVAFFEMTLAVGCGSLSPHTSEPFDARFQTDLDRYPIQHPAYSYYAGYWSMIEDRVVRPVYNIIDVPAHVRRVGTWSGTTEPKEAENINAWDEVPDSSWFTNRIGRFRLEDAELLRKDIQAPDMSGPWTVIAGKSGGVSLGFTVRDPSGQIYFFKFDTPKYPELLTSAEVIASLIMHAVGYFVPANHLVFVRPESFVLGDNPKIMGKYNVPRPMTQEDLDQILSAIDWQPDGTSRAIASRALDGAPIGHFFFEGTRADDPNDRIPHEHRRELRGAHLFSAWINNPDIRAKNTLDTYIGEPGQGFVQHSLLDFGSTLGSRGNRSKNEKDGYESKINYTEAALNLSQLGVRDPYWDEVKHSGFVSVGLFESNVFDPLKWAPWWGNKAWELLTERDAFWATRILIQFSDEQIRTIVAAARYSEPGAADYVAQTLIERRDKIAAVWLTRLTPLDNFLIVDRGPRQPSSIVFEDLGILHNIADPAARNYEFSIESDHYAETKGRHVEPLGNTPGRYTLSLGSYTQKIPTHLRVSIQVEQAGVAVGRGTDVFVYCWAPERCVITGLKRR